MNEIMLLKPVIVAIISAVILLLVPKNAEKIRNSLSLIFSIGVLITCYRILSLCETSPAEYSKHIASIGGFAINLDLFVSYYRAILASFIGFFGVIITLYSIGFNKIKFKEYYYPFLFCAIGFAILVVFANNLFLFLISWEIVTLVLFYLVSFGWKEEAKNAAGKMFIINGASDLLLLTGFILLWKITGSCKLTEIKLYINQPIHYVACFFILIGALTKAGAMPFHSWVPSTCDNAPLPVVALLPAAIDKMLGIYLLAITTINLFTFNTIVSNALMIIGGLTILLAVLFALVQHEAKKLLAYHVISQVGYMVLGIGTGNILGIIGGIFHMINHTIYKSCLFLGEGAVEKATGETNLEKLGGLAGKMPLTLICMSIAALSIAGIPPFNGFVSKWLIYNGVISINRPVFLIIAMFGSALTLASFIKLIHSIFLGNAVAKYDDVKEAKVSMLIPMFLLALLCIGLGIFPQLVFTHIINKGYFARHTMRITAGLLPSTGNWTPLYAVLFMAASYILGFIIYIVFANNIRRTRTFIGGEIFDEESTHVSGTHFFLTIRNFPVLKSIYDDAEKEDFDIYAVISRCGQKIIDILRYLHNGVLTTYLAWCVIGLVVMLLVFAKFM